MLRMTVITAIEPLRVSLKVIHAAIPLSYYGDPYACLSPLHTRSAGSGVQVPTADIPSGDTQVAFILPAGTYPGLHLKNI